MTEGKDAYKYKKIYERRGVLSKPGIEGDFSHWEKTGKSSKWLRYGHSFEGKVNFNEVVALKPDSIIDIGCGWNEFCKEASRRLSIPTFGVDIACPGANYIAPAHSMPKIGDKEYDLLVSFDCIEHIPEEEVEGAFSEFSRVSKRVFLKICLENSHTKIDGEGLHVCLKSKEWWEEISRKYFDNPIVSLRGSAKFSEEKGTLIRTFPGEEPRHLIVIGKCKTR